MSTDKKDDKYTGRLNLVDLTGRRPESVPGPEVLVQPAADDFAPNEVGPGKRVRMHFSLAIAEREDDLIENTFDREPVDFTVGDGNLLPGFEEAIFGLAPGAEQSVILKPEQAFGPYNEDNVQSFASYRFPADLVLEPGLMIDFADAGGNTQAGMIKEFDAQKVTVDFNHPLAGREILFRVSIIDVTPAAGQTSD